MTREEAVYYLIKPIVTSTIPANETVKQLEAWSMAVKALDGEFEPKHGRWVDTGHGCQCSVCETPYRWNEADTMRFCKECGARMDGGEK